MPTPLITRCRDGAFSCEISDGLQAAPTSLHGAKTQRTKELSLTATLGEDLEVEVALV